MYAVRQCVCLEAVFDVTFVSRAIAPLIDELALTNLDPWSIANASRSPACIGVIFVDTVLSAMSFFFFFFVRSAAAFMGVGKFLFIDRGRRIEVVNVEPEIRAHVYDFRTNPWGPL
jgi:hypothetical protein